MNRQEELRQLLKLETRELVLRPDRLLAGAASALLRAYEEAGGSRARLEEIAILRAEIELEQAIRESNPPGPDRAYLAAALPIIRRLVRGFLRELYL